MGIGKTISIVCICQECSRQPDTFSEGDNQQIGRRYQRKIRIMSNSKFKSKLSQEEINKNFEDTDFFEGVMSGLEEARAYEKGAARLATYARKRSLPDVDSVQLRRDLCMTQKDFAIVLGVSTRTVEAWETGRSTPTPTAKKLMYLISLDHSLVKKLLKPA